MLYLSGGGVTVVGCHVRHQSVQLCRSGREDLNPEMLGMLHRGHKHLHVVAVVGPLSAVVGGVCLCKLSHVYRAISRTGPVHILLHIPWKQTPACIPSKQQTVNQCLGQRRRRWANIKPTTLVQRLVLDGYMQKQTEGI